MSALEQALAYEGVDAFLTEVEEKDEEEDREKAKREIRSLVRYAQRFYRTFFVEAFDAEIKGFTFRDKRRVARKLVDRESQGKEKKGGPEVAEQTYLAEYFEDLVDALHGDIDFGYSSDLDDFVEFHNSVYPGWLEAIASWLEAIEHADEAEEISALSTRYWDVASI